MKKLLHEFSMKYHAGHMRIEVTKEDPEGYTVIYWKEKTDA